MRKLKTKIKIIVVLVSVLFLATGCTEYVKDDDGQVKNEITGQRITSNILCKPTNEDIIKIYNDNDISISELPACDEFTINSGGYEGLWTSIFVKPLAWLILKLSKYVGYIGLSLIITGLAIRFALLPVTKRTALQSELLKKAKPDLDKIEKKYKDKKEKEEMAKKSQETMEVYKKYKINPAAGCVFAVIQMPILFAFIEAINRIPAIFEQSFLGLQLGTTPWVAIQNGQYYYIIIVILLAGTTYFSFKLNATAGGTGDQEKQMKLMSNGMIIFITFISFTLSTAISLYWITSSTFTVIQNIIIKRKAEKDGI